jgi:hypothetical protein
MIWECEQRWESVSRGITNYLTLFDQLRRSRNEERVLLITFNYDRLIEQALALSSMKINITEVSDYIRHDAYRLYKLHGSVHWAREVDSPIEKVAERNVWEVAHELIDKAANLTISDRYRMVTARPVGKIDSTPLFPAIAIPVETKRGFECPSAHLASLCTDLKNVTKVLVIGWRATEKHFLDLLKSNLKGKINVQAVAGQKPDAEQIVTRMQDAGISLDGEAVDGGFTEYIISRQAERFFGGASQ